MAKTTTNKIFIVRDLRQKSRYSIDDEYLNSYAKLCGPFGTCVYNSLCRHASKNQECYPSIELIADQHNISRPTVLKGLKSLKEWGIIEITKERDPKTKRQKNNVYILLDKSQWKPKPGALQGPGSIENGLNNESEMEYPGAPQGLGSDTDPSKQDLLGNHEPSKGGLPRAESTSDTDPSKRGFKSRVNDVDCKDTQVKESHIRGSVAEATARICKHDGCGKESMKGVEFCEAHQPMSCQQFVEWYRKSNQRHIKIVAEFVDELRIGGVAPDLRTVAQWREFVSPFRATAVKLSVFDDDQLSAAMKRMMSAKWVTDFNLVTLKKFLINSNK